SLPRGDRPIKNAFRRPPANTDRSAGSGISSIFLTPGQTRRASSPAKRRPWRRLRLRSVSPVSLLAVRRGPTHPRPKFSCPGCPRRLICRSHKFGGENTELAPAGIRGFIVHRRIFALVRCAIAFV